MQLPLPDHHNPLPNATPDQLVSQLLTTVGLSEAIKLLENEQKRRDYAHIATQD